MDLGFRESRGCSHVYIIQRGKCFTEAVLLEYCADAGVVQTCDLAAVCMFKAHEDPEKGGFSFAGWGHQTVDVSAFHR